MVGRQRGGRLVATALVCGLAACGGGGEPAAAPTPVPSAGPTAATTSQQSPAAAPVPATRLTCPGDLVPVRITDRYRFPHPPGSPRQALTEQLRQRGYTEGDENWGAADEFERVRPGKRAVTYVGRRSDGSVAVELRIERQARPPGWVAAERRNCEPRRTPPTAQQATAAPGADPQLT